MTAAYRQIYRIPVSVANAIANISDIDVFDVNVRWSNPPAYVTRAIRYIHSANDALHSVENFNGEVLIALAVAIRHLEAYMRDVSKGYHDYPINADTAYFFRRIRGYFTTIKNYLRKMTKSVDGVSRSKARAKTSTYRSSKNKRSGARRKTSLRYR